MALKLAIDTNSLSQYFRGDQAVKAVFLRSDELCLPVVVYAESLAGYRAGTQQIKNTEILNNFIAKLDVSLLHINEATADWYARIFAMLKAQGSLIPTNDIWIAALCLQYECNLLTADKHFDRVELLSLIRPHQ